MSYKSRIDALLLAASLPSFAKLAFGSDLEQGPPGDALQQPPQPSLPAPAAAPAQALPSAPAPVPEQPVTAQDVAPVLEEVAEDVASMRNDLALLLGRHGASRAQTAPLAALPEADPVILDSVLERARLTRDPADYVRLLSHDPNVNQMARAAALPTLLMSDAMLGRSLQDSQTRESILDALRNLQLPSPTEARPASTLPNNQAAYPTWYPRGHF